MSLPVDAATGLPTIHRFVTAHESAAPHRETHAISHAVETTPFLNGAGREAGLWRVEGIPVEKGDFREGTFNDPTARQHAEFIPPNGAIMRITELAPRSVTPMHRTHSVDVNILLSGSVVHVLASGEEQVLRAPGDSVVQRGTNHRWDNRTDEWARWASVLVSAEGVNVGGKELRAEGL